MTSETDNARYDGVAILVHWLTAAAVLCLFVMGTTMTSLRPGSALQFQLYQMHKSVGITVLGLTVLRVLWRLGHRPPPLPQTMPLWERRAAQAGHLLLYVALIGLPLLGWATVSASPLNLPTLLYGVIPWPHLPILSTLPDKAPVAKALAALHDAGAWALLVLLAVHVGAAMRHHMVLHDAVLRRMLPRFGSGDRGRG
ncbi:MAG TPA: cytochrome b [Patescibacteria group bacterium]|nr:cytochrome b [Patescibacteria group bacterium]